MSFTPHRVFMLAVPLLAALAATSPARASVVLQTTNIAATNIFSVNLTSPGSPGFGATISAAFAGFDTSLGTLTGVSFAYDYDFSFVFNVQAGGGSGGLNTALGINGTPFTASNFRTLSSSVDFSVTGTAVPDALAVALASYASAFTFDLAAFGGVGGGGGAGFSLSSSLDLLPSSVTVTYSFDPAQAAANVPEPTSLALVGAAGLALTLQRRRKATRTAFNGRLPAL